MNIRKQSDRNRYLITRSGVYVRDFTNETAPFRDANHLSTPSEYRLYLENELRNRKLRMQQIDSEHGTWKNVVIVSDGFGFLDKQSFLGKLPSDTIVLAVNGSLASWKIGIGRIHCYVINNPFPCPQFFPRQNRYFPRCIASTRTNPEFTEKYAKKGVMYSYMPTPDSNFSGAGSKPNYCIDDYRNPICAAIGVAYHMGVSKIVLFSCDDSFEDERPAAVKLDNGFYAYPQQLVGQEIIDANLYWLTHQEDWDVEVRDCSLGVKYENAPYIIPEDIASFFGD